MFNAELKEIPEEILAEMEKAGNSREAILKSVEEAKKMDRISVEGYSGEVDKEDLDALVHYAISMVKQVCDLSSMDVQDDPVFGIGLLTGVAVCFDALNLPAILTGKRIGLIVSAAHKYMSVAAEQAIREGKKGVSVSKDGEHFYCKQHGNA